MIKEMSYFVRRGPPLVVTGHQRVRRKLIVLREKKKGERQGGRTKRRIAKSTWEPLTSC